MRVHAMILGLLILVSGCTTTDTRTATQSTQRPPAGAKLALVQPEVSLGLLNAGGMTEPREDWSKEGAKNLATQITLALSTKGHVAQVFDQSAEGSRRLDQILKLNYAVGRSIQSFSYGLLLPSKTSFDWTLGAGVSELRAAADADYALFINARGNYASGGRIGTMLLMSVAGVSIPLGSQTVQLSLVDLKTGQILWYNFALAAPGADMRTPEGAKTLVEALLKDIPL